MNLSESDVVIQEGTEIGKWEDADIFTEKQTKTRDKLGRYRHKQKLERFPERKYKESHHEV